jgi:G3E family GTPase
MSAFPFFQLTSNGRSACEAQRQIASADRILINKTDLISPQDLDDLEGLIFTFNPTAQRMRCCYSQVEVG